MTTSMISTEEDLKLFPWLFLDNSKNKKETRKNKKYPIS